MRFEEFKKHLMKARLDDGQEVYLWRVLSKGDAIKVILVTENGRLIIANPYEVKLL